MVFGTKRVTEALAICFFLVFVLVPTVYVCAFSVTNWHLVESFVFSNPEMVSAIKSSLSFSLKVSLLATLIDLVLAIPLAWLLVRYSFRGRELLDTLVDLPLVIPTAVLGLSATFFWSMDVFSVKSAFLLVLLVLVAFSLPYMVRTLAAILEQIDMTYELAGRSLGASRLTAFRTITLPLFKEGLLTGSVLCFARCISETGAVSIALSTLGSSAMTATVLIGNFKQQAGQEYIVALSFLSAVLIVLGLGLVAIANFLARRVKIPVVKVFPMGERILGGRIPAMAKNVFALLLFFVFSLIPASFIMGRVFGGLERFPLAFQLAKHIAYSFGIAGVVTVVNILFGIPLAVFLARRTGFFSRALDSIVAVPIMVPTAAVGFSLGLFWSNLAWIPTFVLIILAHVSITYPYMVKSVSAAVRGVDVELEEAARTLGASHPKTFRTITLPLIKPAIIAGALISFTRSLGETGATLAVSPKAITVPVYIVNLVRDGMLDEASGACIILIIVSFLLLVGLRYASRKRKKKQNGKQKRTRKLKRKRKQTKQKLGGVK